MTKTNLTEYGLSAANAERRQKWVRILIYIGLALGTFAAYEPILHNGFVAFDDDAYITKNPNVTGGISQDSVIRAFTKTHSANWHPLTWLSHMLDCEFFGLNPSWHHLVSLLFHIANALLLFGILTNMTGSTWASAFVAAVFALHPVQVESVAWASERKTVLSGLFWFLTIAVYIRYTKRPSIGRYILLFLVYTLSIMTKPVVVTLPLVLLLLDYWPLERLNWGSSPAGKTVPAGRLLIEKIPLLLLAAFLSVMTFIAQQHGGTVRTLERFPLDHRIANMFVSYIKYIGKLIWPSRLAVIYPHPEINLSDPVVIICIVSFVLITVFSIYAGRFRKYVAVGWLWYIGTLVPMIGLIQVGMQAMADRYMYIPMLGLLVMGVWTIKEFFTKRVFEKVILAVLVPASLLSAAIITRMQVGYWRDTKTIFEHTLRVTKENAVVENAYGATLYNEGRINEAEAHIRKALSIWPKFFDARNTLGKILLKQGKYNEAVFCFTELLRDKKKLEELHYNLATALSKQKKYDEAAEHLAAILEMNPNYSDTREKLGITLLAAGRTDESIACLNEALSTSANKAGIYANLGTAYLLQGNNKMAVQNWNKAVELEPNSPEVLNNLSWLLATVNDAEIQDAARAIALAQRSCELTAYRSAESLDTLAAAYAAAGRFPDAVLTAGKALNAAKSAGQEDLSREIQNRLELYKTARPYRGK